MKKGITLPALLLCGVFVFGQSTRIEKMLDSLKESRSDSKKIALLSKIAIAYSDSNYTKSLVYWKKALNLSLNQRNRDYAGDAYHQIGYTYMKMGEMGKALKNYQNAADVYRYTRNKKSLAGVYNDIGLIYRNQGKFDIALKNYLESLRLYNELSDIEGSAIVSNSIGQIYFYQENYPKAVEFFMQYFKVNQKLGNVRAVAGASNNIASAYMELNHYDDALEFFMKSLNIYDSLGIDIGVAIIRDNIGSLFFKKKQHNNALLYHLSALELFRKLKSPVRICFTLKNISEIYLAQERYSQAIKTLNESLQLAIQTEQKETERDIYKLLSEAYEKTGNSLKAYRNLKRFIALNDSIINVETLQKIEALQMEAQKEKHQRDIAEMNRKLKQQQLILYATLIGSFLFMLFLLFLLIENRGKRKALKKLQNLRSELYEYIGGAFDLLQLVKTDQTLDGVFSDSWNRLPDKSLGYEAKLYHFKAGSIIFSFILIYQHNTVNPSIFSLTIYNLINRFIKSGRSDFESLNNYLNSAIRNNTLTGIYPENSYRLLPFAIKENRLLNLSGKNFAIRQHGAFLMLNEDPWFNLHPGDIAYFFFSMETVTPTGEREFRKLIKSIDLVDFPEQPEIADNFLKTFDFDTTTIIFSLKV